MAFDPNALKIQPGDIMGSPILKIDYPTDRKRIAAWVDALDGPQAAEAQAGLAELGQRAALHLVFLIDEAKGAPAVRKLLRACAVVTGKSAGELKDDATAAEMTRVCDEAKSALRAFAQRAVEPPGGSR